MARPFHHEKAWLHESHFYEETDFWPSDQHEARYPSWSHFHATDTAPRHSVFLCVVVDQQSDPIVFLQ